MEDVDFGGKKLLVHEIALPHSRSHLLLGNSWFAKPLFELALPTRSLTAVARSLQVGSSQPLHLAESLSCDDPEHAHQFQLHALPIHAWFIRLINLNRPSTKLNFLSILLAKTNDNVISKQPAKGENNT